MLIFYLTIVNKTFITVTLGWHDSRQQQEKKTMASPIIKRLFNLSQIFR